MNETIRHQPQWVLLSASADQREIPAIPAPGLDDPTLIDARRQNQQSPTLLVQRLPRRWERASNARIAILIIGELRCIKRTEQLFRELNRQADIFVVTNSDSAKAAVNLTEKKKIYVIEEHAKAHAIDQSLPLNSMKQWHKLALGIQLVQRTEHQQKRQYTHFVKMRSDYYYAHPKRILSEAIEELSDAYSGLVGASDKVFAGRRDHLCIFKGFFQAITGWFDQREQLYWPINLQQVLASDDALKWYGMNWPVELIGRPKTTEQWRQRLIAGGSALEIALAKFKPNSDTSYHRLFQGHPRFASEVSFARFLNFNGIPFRECRSLRGFLYIDRNSCP